MNNEAESGNPIENKWGDHLIEMYVKLILKGRRVFSEVPEEIKEEVRQLLIQKGREDLTEV